MKNEYTQHLLQLVQVFKKYIPKLPDEVQDYIEDIDLDYITVDLPNLFASMASGSTRIAEIVKSLRTFSRLDEAEMKTVDIHAGIDSTLMILPSRLSVQSVAIEVIKNSGYLSSVHCYARLLNQVILNLINHGINRLELKLNNNLFKTEKTTLTIKTK